MGNSDFPSFYLVDKRVKKLPFFLLNANFFVSLEEIEKRNEEQSFETAEIKASLKSLDRERDDLQQQVDEKTEEIIQMEAKKIQLVS